MISYSKCLHKNNAAGHSHSSHSMFCTCNSVRVHFVLLVFTLCACSGLYQGYKANKSVCVEKRYSLPLIQHGERNYRTALGESSITSRINAFHDAIASYFVVESGVVKKHDALDLLWCLYNPLDGAI